MTQQIQKKKKKQLEISPELQNALNELAVDFGKLQPKVDQVFEIGRLEGLGDMQIGKLVRKAMKEHYSSKTRTRVLEEYPEALYKNNARPNRFPKKNVDKMSTNQQEDEERYEGTIYYFKADEFDINDIETKNRSYLITAVEHWYAEARKWKQKYDDLPTTKPKTTKKITSEKAKIDLLKKGFGAMMKK